MYTCGSICFSFFFRKNLSFFFLYKTKNLPRNIVMNKFFCSRVLSIVKSFARTNEYELTFETSYPCNLYSLWKFWTYSKFTRICHFIMRYNGVCLLFNARSFRTYHYHMIFIFQPCKKSLWTLWPCGMYIMYIRML